MIDCNCVSNTIASNSSITTTTTTTDQVTYDSFQDTPWVKTYWRPMMGWLYMLLVLFDFILAPLFLPYIWKSTGMTAYPWHPLTLEGGGLIHLTFGAILGIAAWTRGQEKIEEMRQ